jgi:hypothetical protein
MALTLVQMKTQFKDPFRQGVVDLLWQSSRVMSRLSFIQNAGLSYAYSAKAKLPGVAFRALNSSFTATAGTTLPKTETLTILGGRIQTDSVAISLKGDAARTNQINMQIEAAAKDFDKYFFNGDPTVTGHANELLGLKKRLTGSQLLTQAADGAVITWEKVQALLAAVNGPNNNKTLFMNQTNRINLINDALADSAGKGLVENRNGTWYFDGAEIAEVWNDAAEAAILGFTETCGAGTTCSSVYAVRLGRTTDEQGVQGLSGLPGDIMVDGPIKLGEYVVDIVQMVAGVGIFGGYEAARLQGVKAS